MARSIKFDPLQKFRFGVQIGLDGGGNQLGFAGVSITSDGPWRGPGKVALRKQMCSELVSLLQGGPVDLLVNAFHRGDPNDEPRFVFVLKGCRPSEATLGELEFDATDSGVLTAVATIPYGSLTILSEPTPLVMLALAAD